MRRQSRLRESPAPAKDEREPEAESPRGNPWSGADTGALLAVIGAVCLTFFPVAGYGFLNWDDPAALVRNASLDGPDGAAWALTTTHLSHYQPLSWLVWRSLRAALGTSPQVHHTASLLGHAMNAALLFLLGRRVFALAGVDPRRLAAGRGVGRVVLCHPSASCRGRGLGERIPLRSGPRVSPPVGPLLSRGSASGGRTLPVILALLAYGASLLCRPLALAFPVLLLALDGTLRRPLRRSLLERAPFFVLALAGGLMEWGARSFAPLERVGLGPRLSAAAFRALRLSLPCGSPARSHPPGRAAPRSAHFLATPPRREGSFFSRSSGQAGAPIRGIPGW